MCFENDYNLRLNTVALKDIFQKLNKPVSSKTLWFYYHYFLVNLMNWMIAWKKNLSRKDTIENTAYMYLNCHGVTGSKIVVLSSEVWIQQHHFQSGLCWIYHPHFHVENTRRSMVGSWPIKNIWFANKKMKYTFKDINYSVH